MKGKIIFLLCLALINVVLISTVFAQQVQVGTVGVNAVGVYEGCQNKLFGLVGASNTADIDAQGNKVPSSWSNVNIIKVMCPGATVFLHAKGGTWPGAQVSLVQAVLQNDNLDYIILDPSANGQQASSSITSEEYKAAAINLAQIVKNKNKDIKVIMLANTPLKGAGGGYGTPETAQKVKAFNADLLNNKLGRPDLIDYAVDTYSATEDPAGSDSCGKYCGGDNLHFGEAGRKQVMKAVMDTVFGDPAIATAISNAPVSQSLGAENCQNKQRCEEIDAIWLKIAVWINNAARKGRVFDTVKGWRSYQEVRPTVVITPAVTKPNAVSTNFCVATLGTNEQKALLDTIAWAEGTREKYNIMFGGKEFTTYSSHPVETGEMPPRGITAGGYTSTAAGRYQFVYDTFKDLQEEGYFKTGFGFEEQETAALEGLVIKKRHLSEEALKNAVDNGNFEWIWDKLAGEWASLPYSPKGGQSYYGQPVQSNSDLINVYLTCLEHHSAKGSAVPQLEGVSVGVLTSCPSEMANIENKYCIDRWENSIYNKNNPSEKASIYYPAETSLANFFYNYWIKGWKGTPPPNPAYALMPERGAEITAGFAPLAVSQENIVPNMYVNKKIAEQACANVKKRLCAEDEWVQACKGPSSTKYPYGDDYAAEKCNTHQAGKYPPGVVGWTTVIPENQFDPSDPRNGKAAVDIQGVRETGSFPECTNAYGVYDMVGNLAEVVSTPSSSGYALFKGAAFMRDGNNLNCDNNIGKHASTYTDYSFGFRCCVSLS